MDKGREEGRLLRREAEKPLFGRQEPRGVRNSADLAKRTYTRFPYLLGSRHVVARAKISDEQPMTGRRVIW